MKKLLKTVAITMALSGFCMTNAHAAKVECSFMSETTISTSGEWLATEMDFVKLMDLFGDGLTLPLENSLLGNLDSGKVFLAGEVDRGRYGSSNDVCGTRRSPGCRSPVREHANGGSAGGVLN